MNHEKKGKEEAWSLLKAKGRRSLKRVAFLLLVVKVAFCGGVPIIL